MKKYLIIFLSIISSTVVYGQGYTSIQQRKLSNAINAITSLYVDSVSDKKLVETAIEAMLKKLDPHSSYIPREEVERVNEPLEGSFEGVGKSMDVGIDAHPEHQVFSWDEIRQKLAAKEYHQLDHHEKGER